MILGRKRLWTVLILLLAFCGIAVSAYLAGQAPLAWYGVALYSIVFILAALELLMYRWYLRRLVQGFAFIGLVAAAWFTILQGVGIEAFCIHCVVSAVISLLIFICAALLEPLRPWPPVREALPPPSSPPTLLMPPAP